MKRTPTELDLKIELRPVGDLVPYAGNARTHSTRQVEQIAASIRQFGFVNPVLIDDANGVIAGHGRLEAAKSLGFAEVPTIRLSHLTKGERRAYVLADNRLAELAGWDEDILKIELQGLQDLELDFELEVIGFEGAELDLLLDTSTEPAVDKKADAVVKVAAGPAITQLGDLWLLGDHRLLCGDALKPEAYQTLMAGEQARMIFTDPPYNVKIDGHAGGKGKVERREFVMASGEMSQSQFTTFLTDSLTAMAGCCVDGAIAFVCMDWRHIDEVMAAGRAAFDELKNLIVWAKTNGGMGAFYRSRHELIFAFKKGRASHVNTFGLGEGGRYRTNVWDYPGVNTFTANRDAELDMHPTVKPVALVADAIKDVSRRGDIVLDAFGGSGTTLIAAEKTGRQARLLELDPLYADVICRRWEKYAKRPALLAATGQTFDEVAETRAAATAEPEQREMEVVQ
ncbi:MAG TPA: site-specific DNA-methyltransferase [Caulobacter sp.]|nr:site-specific DNA-methyltransferase [Caulobacter sp.]